MKKLSNLTATLPVPMQTIERRIYLIRGVKVMFDYDLSELYQVPTKSLNLAVKRNKERFPLDFMFQLNSEELNSLRFQIETSKKGRGGRRYYPYVFTEQGVAMLSSVLNSQRAIAVNIAITRAFVKLREIMATHKDLARKMEQIEDKQAKQEFKITQIFKIIDNFFKTSEEPKTKIGFRV